MQDAQTGY